MKTSLFSMIALATSAFAAPFVHNASPGFLPHVHADNVHFDSKVPAKRYGPVPVNIPSKAPANAAGNAPAAISDNDGLFGSLQGAKSSLGDVTWSLKYIVDRFTDGKIPEDDAADQAFPELKKMETILTGIVGQLNAATGIKITGIADIQALISLCVDLSASVLGNLNIIVGAIGTGHADIKVIVISICNILGKVLVLVAGLVSAIVPGLNEALRPIIAGIGQGVLSPFLGQVDSAFHGLLSGLPL